MVGHRAAVDDRADDLGIVLVVDPQLDQAVVDQDAAAYGYVGGELLVGDGGLILGAHDLFRGQSELLALLQHDLSAFEVSETDLGTLCIQEGSDVQSQFAADLDDSVKLCLVLRMGAVGKVESCYVHAGQHQLAELLFAFCSRADGADDFCFTHMFSPVLFERFVYFQHLQYNRKSCINVGYGV